MPEVGHSASINHAGASNRAYVTGRSDWGFVECHMFIGIVELRSYCKVPRMEVGDSTLS